MLLYHEDRDTLRAHIDSLYVMLRQTTQQMQTIKDERDALLHRLDEISQRVNEQTLLEVITVTLISKGYTPIEYPNLLSKGLWTHPRWRQPNTMMAAISDCFEREAQ